MEPKVLKLVYSLSIMIGGLSTGYLAKKKGYLGEEISPFLIKYLIISSVPLINSLILWNLHISSFQVLKLPLAGALISTAAFLPALLLSSYHKLDRKQTGSFILSALFSNIGLTMGGFLCFVLFGERGYGFSVIYVLYFSLYFYSIGYHVARSYGSETNSNSLKNLLHSFSEPGSLLPLTGVALGLILSFSRIPRPQFFSSVSEILIPINSFVILFSIGLSLRFSGLKDHRRKVFSMAAIKFIYSPIVGLMVIRLLSLSGIMAKVVFIEACTPVAISSLMLVILFKLDHHIANFSWIYTTTAFILLLPLFLFLVDKV